MIEWLNNDLESHEDKNDYRYNEYDESDSKYDESVRCDNDLPYLLLQMRCLWYDDDDGDV